MVQVGDRFGSWKVIELNSPKTSSRYMYCLCQCDCGMQSEVYESNLRHQQSTQCRKCAGKKASDRLTRGRKTRNIDKLITDLKRIIGYKYKNFTVIEAVKNTLFMKGISIDYLCVCTCGKQSLRTEMQLRNRVRKPYCDHCKPKDKK